MPQKKDEDIIASTLKQVRYSWRHRKGNETVGLILDTFDNLGLVTKDNRQPVAN